MTALAVRCVRNALPRLTPRQPTGRVETCCPADDSSVLTGSPIPEELRWSYFAEPNASGCEMRHRIAAKRRAKTRLGRGHNSDAIAAIGPKPQVVADLDRSGVAPEHYVVGPGQDVLHGERL